MPAVALPDLKCRAGPHWATLSDDGNGTEARSCGRYHPGSAEESMGSGWVIRCSNAGLLANWHDC